MKKILLTSILSIIGFIGFSSAGIISKTNYSFPAGNNLFPLSNFNNGNISVSFSDKTPDVRFMINASCCEDPSKSVSSNTEVLDGTSGNFDIIINNANYLLGENYCSSYCVHIRALNDAVSNITLSSSMIVPPVLEEGSTTFTPIINGLTTSINEFIPYVAYIGLGLLSVIIGFVAIKRLINRVRAKILGTFSGGRKK